MKTDRFRGFTPTPICIVGENRENMQKRVHGQTTISIASNKLVWGFTLVEVLTAVVIIAIMLGVLMPALSQVKKLAGSTKQKAQLCSIEIGLNLYKNDMGEYPPSHGWKPDSTSPADHNGYTYTGAHTLAEAMVGYDLLGFGPNSKYDPFDTDDVYADANDRKGPYLDRTNIGVFEPNQIFKNIGSLDPNGHLICDVFSFKSEKIGNKRCKIGTPVLYFRANLSPVNMQSKINQAFHPHTENVYNYFDNYYSIATGTFPVNGKRDHKFYKSPADGGTFYDFIMDPMIPKTSGTCGRPVRPDSFLLISAGYDGIYGTKDDICNFEPNIY